MTEQKSEHELMDAIRKTLDDSTRDIDAKTLSRIRQIRNRALEQTASKTYEWLNLATGAVVTASVMIFAISIALKSPSGTSLTDEDLELISASESLDLYEDLEFYEWLDDYELPT